MGAVSLLNPVKRMDVMGSPLAGRAWRLGWAAFIAGLLSGMSSAPLLAETIVLNDGTVIDGEIMVESKSELTVRTVHGVRKLKRKDIKQMFADRPGVSEIGSGDFGALPPISQQILNARALYLLGDYQGCIDRVKPSLDPKGTDSNQMLIRWLMIESLERLAKFDEARKVLDYVVEHGEPVDKIRAEAHLQIFNDNPQYDLRLIGEKFARFFITDPEVETKAKEPNSLADPAIMELALREVCDQILLNDEVSVEAFRRTLKVEDSLRALQDAAGRPGNAAKALPYLKDLQKVEASFYRVQAILPRYGDAFELDLVRTESEHMLDVIETIFQQVLALNPETLTPAFDGQTGLLTPDGRQEWRDRCDEFLEQSKPVEELIEYLLGKVQRYPRDLRTLNSIYNEKLERLNQMQQLATKRRDRSRL